MISLLEDYLDSTTVHGFAYLHRKQHWISRFLWVNINNASHTIRENEIYWYHEITYVNINDFRQQSLSWDLYHVDT